MLLLEMLQLLCLDILDILHIGVLLFSQADLNKMESQNANPP